jgi:small subunit ribosomal protein S9
MSKEIHVSGKRKRAIARATITAGTGKVIINNTNIEAHEPKLYRLRIREPLLIAGERASKINVSVKIIGGGINGQADAARLAIGKAISKYFDDPKLTESLLKYDRNLLVADVRRKETSKPNRHGHARSKVQKSYR